MRRAVPMNVDREGVAKTVLAGYFKYGVQTLLTGDFGTSGTVVLEIYEEESDERREGRHGEDDKGSVLEEQPCEFRAWRRLGCDCRD